MIAWTYPEAVPGLALVSDLPDRYIWCCPCDPAPGGPAGRGQYSQYRPDHRVYHTLLESESESGPVFLERNRNRFQSVGIEAQVCNRPAHTQTNGAGRELPLLDSIVVSIPACHAGDRGSIPRRGAFHYQETEANGTLWNGKFQRSRNVIGPIQQHTLNPR